MRCRIDKHGVAPTLPVNRMSADRAQYRLLLGSPQVSLSTPGHPANDPLHRHTFFEPCIVAAGSGTLDHGGQRFALKPGDLFVSDVGVVHAIRSLETRDLKLFYTSFAVAEAGEDGERDGFLPNHVIWNFLKGHRTLRPGQDHLVACFEYLVRVALREELPHRRFFLQEWMRLLVLQIMAALTHPSRAESIDTDGGDALQRAIHAIDERLHQPVRVRDIARASGMSGRSLQRLFRERLKCTVIDEIQERRMQRAAMLLVLRGLSVAEVGRRVGIDDPAQFSRAFKKQTGLTPREFRTSHSPSAHAWIQVGTAAMKTEFVEQATPRRARRDHIG